MIFSLEISLIKKLCLLGIENKCDTTLFNQVGQLRTSSHLKLRPGQDKAKQCDKNNNTELHINKRTVNNTINKCMDSVC